MTDVDAVGGVPAVMKDMLSAGLLHGDCMTVTGKTVEENLADVAPCGQGQDVIFPISNPLAPAGRHIRVLRGSLAPGGAVLKASGKDLSTPFSGPARVFDGEDAAYNAVMAVRQGCTLAGGCRVLGHHGALLTCVPQQPRRAS